MNITPMTHEERLALIAQPFPRIRLLTTSYPNGGVQISRQGMGIDGPRTKATRNREERSYSERRQSDEPQELFCSQDRSR
jgi:hypothetical protein